MGRTRANGDTRAPWVYSLWTHQPLGPQGGPWSPKGGPGPSGALSVSRRVLGPRAIRAPKLPKEGSHDYNERRHDPS